MTCKRWAISAEARCCPSCEMGKSARHPVAKAAASRQTRLGELTHSDLCGPMTVPSVMGMRYAVVFVDDASRYTTLFC